ncbi:hypothetical protein CB0940_12280 [Cercospora beticola]|uniref:Uncharacterized protein n=1 Tax=Cercospora beticola TaxID=122368 RepID=A0A2G5GJF8_CERBT|nr:hypothetical protein CB0940_12280 [Cercospora beticola]PIA80408.1 hypothetical protein CB0940_12280 [Cercospora beticola]WPB03932.1 hypothetical protein RHO25_008576 [Cercospora beticola]CAK1357278.1 unnamed protein product [Cercospora beticola]
MGYEQEYRHSGCNASFLRDKRFAHAARLQHHKRIRQPARVKLMHQARCINPNAVTIRQELDESLGDKTTRVSMLTLLSVGFACPQTVSQFFQLLPAVCGYTHLWLLGLHISTVSIMTSIDQLKSDARANAILRRIYLA